MKYNKLIKLAAVALAAVSVNVAKASENDDQLWYKLGAGLKVADETSLVWEQEFRYNGDGDMYDKETLILAKQTITSTFSIAAGYRNVSELKTKTIYDDQGNESEMDYWKNEDRPTLDFLLKQKLESGWKIDERFRVEYRMKDGDDNFARYRFRVRVKSPFKWTDYSINPWAAYEVFYSQGSIDEVHRHRFYLGLGAKLTENVSAGVYYLYQDDLKSENWSHKNVLGLSAGLKF